MVFATLVALSSALSRGRSNALDVQPKALRFALAVVAGLMGWLLYLRFGLPAVQYVNGRDPLVFQAMLLLLSVAILGVVIQRRLATRRRVG